MQTEFDNDNKPFTFVNISKGKLIFRKDGVEYHSEYLEGYLKDIFIRDKSFDGTRYKQLCLLIGNDSEDAFVQIRLDSGYGLAFCKIIKNCYFDLMLKIIPVYTEVGEKRTTSLFIHQDGSIVPWYYKKANMKDCPGIQWKIENGRYVPDNSRQQEFFINLLLGEIKPKLAEIRQGLFYERAAYHDNRQNSRSEQYYENHYE